MGYVGKVLSLSPLLLPPRIDSPFRMTMAPAIVLAEPSDVRLLGYSAAAGWTLVLDHEPHQSLRLLASPDSLFSADLRATALRPSP